MNFILYNFILFATFKSSLFVLKTILVCDNHSRLEERMFDKIRLVFCALVIFVCLIVLKLQATAHLYWRFALRMQKGDAENRVC